MEERLQSISTDLSRLRTEISAGIQSEEDVDRLNVSFLENFPNNYKIYIKYFA